MKQGNKNLNKIIDFLHEAGKLKTTHRFGANKKYIGDSSADHSWRLSLLSFIFAEETGLRINSYKALKIALVHDLAEALAGDVDARLISTKVITKADKMRAEKKAIKKMIKILPPKSGKEIGKLWNEYENAKTKEARYVKALDKIETQIKVIEEGYKKYDTPELIGWYGRKEVMNFKELSELFKIIKVKLKKEFKKGNIPWNKGYETLK